ncbi:putative aminoacyltransferase, E1 ubiquitin-activating enzyme [Lupinus albus]|uniref:Putative aminoacyltransferase, E1 ubiquitin-activating enzyme n=1 Tax=Lupinus albus TaxID=3870 RepID=A0A6A4Q942_LUPAL|nr:putative aminoacyltransferase, E1 ubiquitin-activating enzyme [Lupinus albus]
MDGGDNSLSDKEEENDDVDFTEILSRVRLVDAPILLFVCFHKAMRSELRLLRRIAKTASLEDEHQRSRETIVKLRSRFQFLKLAQKYHCAAEDELIFRALDIHVKNVASTYSLEHSSTEDLFDSIFYFLDELMGTSQSFPKLFQELLYSIAVLQTSINQNMLKEEKQVFPLLMQKLSTKEQASLVWQFICSVPIMFLEEVLPWMVSFLSADKKTEVTQCLSEIAPMEKALQEVLVSWVVSNNQTFGEAYFEIEEVQCADGSLHKERSLRLSSCNKNCKEVSSWMKMNGLEIEDGVNQVNVLQLWHEAIKKDLKEILKELHLIRNSSCFQNLDAIVTQINFFADVLFFYSNAQKTFFHPLLNKPAYDWLPKSTEQFLGESHIEDLQQLLCNSESGMPLCNFVEELCRKLESFISGVKKQFAFQETEVFPVIKKNCRNGIQERLLSLSLQMMPLGLLRCVINWFSVHLSEKESMSILYYIKKGNHFVCEAFSSLLHEWFCIGYSGKTSIEKFRQDLQHMFKSRWSFLPEKIKERSEFSLLNSGQQPNKVSGKNCLSNSSSSGSNNSYKYETPYSIGINLHIFFPATVGKLHQSSRFHVGSSSSISFLGDPKPIDLIFFFHKAIRKDLDYLVLGSAQLEQNSELLMDFRKRFHLICFLHQIHTDAEDEVVFPALEARGKLKNISHAYTFDHKLDDEHFDKVSRILDKMSELHLPVSTIDSNVRENIMLRQHHLCRKLQQMCKSMHKLLSDHLNREEIEIWPMIRELFSNQEQEKIIGCMLGRIKAEILQDMIPWLMASLTQEEQHVAMFLWSMATKNTSFDEWLGEWWDGYSIAKATEGSNDAPLPTIDPLEVISEYLSEEVLNELQESSPNKSKNLFQKDHTGDNVDPSNYNVDGEVKVHNAEPNNKECSKFTDQFHDNKKHAGSRVTDITNLVNNGQSFQLFDKSEHYDRLLKLSQDDLEMAIRRVSRDSCLDPQKKSYIIQNLLMSRWIISQQISSTEVNMKSDGQEFPGKHPSYRDPLKLIYGCKHYKRNCKLFAPCCNQLHTCIHCHNEVSEPDHSIDRKYITKMMCMKCLVIQPIGATCSTISCCNLSMAKYYCRICKLFEDEREIYHCPYCNLCRVGKGLGVDYFHCMNCNACMSRSLMVHTCREKHLDDNCPICHEYIFTSCSPVKALSCGHVMHSTCFQEYTCFNYTCPICSKSLGDMQVYFNMLDALLAEEEVPEELSGRTQVILCNDCEKKGASPFHWLYHKCRYCGSYNTRVL